MSKEIIAPQVKKISLSTIVEDLSNGLTKWKKDDIGFGSLEKKYNLTPTEAVQLFAHPKIKDVETRIPTFVIIDDIPGTEETVNTNTESGISKAPETRVEVAPVIKAEAPKVVQQTTVIVRQEEIEEPVVPFI